jgi:hypothetical protein
MVGMASVLAFSYPSANPPIDYAVVFDGANDHIATWNTSLLGAQPSEATLAATQASAPYQTFIAPAATEQRVRDSSADKVVTDPSAVGRAVRGAAAVLVDEINALRQRDRDRADDVAAATSLADLKVRWAARAALADRTLAQAKSAIQNKITTGVAD